MLIKLLSYNIYIFLKKNKFEISTCLILTLIYLVTMLPHIGYSGDTCQFQYLGKVLGVGHAGGYPTYVLINHAFQRIFPFFNLAYKSNLLSAIFTIGSIFVLLNIFSLFNFKKETACICGFAFGITPTLWSQSIVAEVYTLNLFFLSLVVFLLFKWKEYKNDKILYFAILVYSISLGNHLQMFCVAPAIFYFIWTQKKDIFFDVKKILFMFLLFLLGLSQYLLTYIMLQYKTSPIIMINFLHDPTYLFRKNILFPFSFNELIFDKIPYFIGLFVAEWGITALLIIIIGLFLVKRKILIFFLLIIFFTFITIINYGIFDIKFFLIPIYFVMAIFLGFSLNFFLTNLNNKTLYNLFLFISFLILLNKLITTYPTVNQNQNIFDKERIEKTLHHVEKDSIIVGGYIDTQCLFYYILGHNYQEKFNLYSAFLVTPEDVEKYLKEGNPLYLHQQRIYLKPGLRVYLTNENLISYFLAADEFKIIKTPIEALFEVVKKN